MTDEQQELSDKFWQAHLIFQAFVAVAADDDSSLGKTAIKAIDDALLELYQQWRTFIKDPISLDPKLFAAELHHIADRIERGDLKL